MIYVSSLHNILADSARASPRKIRRLIIPQNNTTRKKGKTCDTSHTTGSTISLTLEIVKNGTTSCIEVFEMLSYTRPKIDVWNDRGESLNQKYGVNLQLDR